LRVWWGKDGRGLEKKEGKVEEIDDIERGRLWDFIFLHNKKSFSSGKLKNCTGVWFGELN